MGVPKFFRWISERYPCLGELIKDYQVPEFDNLYLDMNGIFHVCSHPDDDNAHFRITEENIFKNIFRYIEVLFRKIKPQKVFFMAVDGVAPRAKLNQQRGRRFRTAKIAEDAVANAERNGEVLPSQAPFDSNCITPGTEFMTKLDEQLKYFITNKISTDTLWQSCTVIYSGHKTPGEGEHKIMDYIRYCKSQEGCDANTRHCLYGLDADLIMLGLASHEPHFTLLREEIIYGKKTRRIQSPEEINFYLFHLSLLREYLHKEFASLHNIHFGYDIESLIDDVVLLGFLVGNDFIPNLPELHINKEGLPLLFSTYKKCLPSLDGYINEKGALNLGRFQIFMHYLSELEIEKFRDINDDLKYLASKKRTDSKESKGTELELFSLVDDNSSDMFGCSALESISNEEVKNTYEKLGLDEQQNFSESEDDSLSEEEQIFRSEFRQYKHNYYMAKFNFSPVTSEVLKDLAVHYVRGLQWILNYYFNGICSWSWFYPFHYSPYISDVTNFDDVEIHFEMSAAFLPYQQLLSVLPPYSVNLVPSAYRHLMILDNSPLNDFYPKTFNTDLNGKMQEWEAVVLIPFIDENCLINAMELCNANLLPEEMKRNQHGPQFLYNFTPDNLGIYRAPEYFSSVIVNHAAVIEKPKTAWYLNKSQVFKGLHPDIDLKLYFNGFPTFYHLDHTFRIAREDVKVFQQNSRNESIILKISPKGPHILDNVATEYIDKFVYVSWPHLTEAKVIAVSDGKRKCQLIDKSLADFDMNAHEEEFWHLEKKELAASLLKRWGIDVGSIEILVHCKAICGLRYTCSREGEIKLEKQWSPITSTHPLQVVVSDIRAFQPNYQTYRNMEELFTVGKKVFMLGKPHYGSVGTVTDIPEDGRVRVEMITREEPNLSEAKTNFYRILKSYMLATEAASHIGISSSLFARVTGNILVSPAARLQPFQKDQKFVNKTNIGMNLKNNFRGEEVKGYTRKENNIWLYSVDCVKAVEAYYLLFPEVFEFINASNSGNDLYEDEIFQQNWQENFRKLKKYVEEAEFCKAERKKCMSVELDLSSLTLADTQIAKYAKIAARSIFMRIKPCLLFVPSSLQGSSPPDSTVSFHILDRVVNIREGYCVSLGARGTIIGIHPSKNEIDSLYDVMFDEEFPGGSAFLGNISAGRCCRMYWSTIINLCHADRKTGKEGQLTSRWPQRTNKPPGSSWSNIDINKSRTTKSKHNTSSGFQLTKYNGNNNSNSKDFSPIKSPRDEKEAIAAPAPSALPSPYQFTLKSIQKYLPKEIGPDTSPKTAHKITKDCRTSTSHQQGESINVSKLEFLIHGTQFCNWQAIKREGLGNGREYIHCVNYIPKYFPILIYLDIKKLVRDGYKFKASVNNEILCSTNDQRKIPLQYIEKAYHTTNSDLIYVSPNCRNEKLNLPCINWMLKSKGRGQALKDFKEEIEKDDPLLLYRRITGNLQSLNSISKEKCVFPGIMQLYENGSATAGAHFVDYRPENSHAASNIDLSEANFPSLQTNVMDGPAWNKLGTYAITEPVSKNYVDSIPMKIDLSEVNFPGMKNSACKPAEKFKAKSFAVDFEGCNNRKMLALENIFVPTQVSRSNTSVTTMPNKSPHRKSDNSRIDEHAVSTGESEKARSPAGPKPKVVRAKVRRRRVVANLGETFFDNSI